MSGIKKYLHWSDPDKTLAALKRAGIGAVSLANNHILDCGADGLHQTIMGLEHAGIGTFGAGDNLPAAEQPHTRTIRVGPTAHTIVIFGGFEFRRKYERRYGWYATADRPGAAVIDPTTIRRQINELRTTVPNSIFLAYPHWGTDYLQTAPYQRNLTTGLLDAGIDLIVGHGAHVLQGVETIRGRRVVFGLGNFVFNSPGRFAKTGAPPFGLTAALRLYHNHDRMRAFLRLYPLLVDNHLTKFQNRPVTKSEFSHALSLILRTQGTDLTGFFVGTDEVGHYLDIRAL